MNRLFVGVILFLVTSFSVCFASPDIQLSCETHEEATGARLGCSLQEWNDEAEDLQLSALNINKIVEFEWGATSEGNNKCTSGIRWALNHGYQQHEVTLLDTSKTLRFLVRENVSSGASQFELIDLDPNSTRNTPIYDDCHISLQFVRQFYDAEALQVKANELLSRLREALHSVEYVNELITISELGVNELRTKKTQLEELISQMEAQLEDEEIEPDALQENRRILQAIVQQLTMSQESRSAQLENFQREFRVVITRHQQLFNQVNRVIVELSSDAPIREELSTLSSDYEEATQR